ncbi:MAG: DUF4860 domain-containing protein [Clostridia bacterium]|nr:DUF4860 domain-containing protein [Clostridia bacterium]
MKFRDRNNTIESVMVMILLIIITLAIFLLVEGGSHSYHKILENKENFEKARIASSYINLKIKQNDERDAILLKHSFYRGENVLVIKHSGEEEGLVTYVFFSDGVLYECYTDQTQMPSIDFSEKIIEVQNVSMEDYKEGKGIVVTTSFKFNDELRTLRNMITFRADR